MENNKNKNVIITGGSRGIGKAIARKMLEQGYNVFICGRSEGNLEKTKREFFLMGEIDYFILDISNREAVKNFVAQWNRPLYGLINNAGAWKEERIDEPEKDIWDEMINLNLAGLYFLTKGLYPKITMPGRIINISSQLGLNGRAGFGPYAAAKHGVNGLTKCWAEELGGKGITVNSICPGWIKTKSNIDEIHLFAQAEGKTFEEKFREISDTCLMKRFIEPEEVANLAVFFMSEEGSGICGKIYEIK
jgi:NAD(P)-dependent dehydrogenase (short-subunit alcohol dehydrogenase family)